jgi:hypothetical protein
MVHFQNERRERLGEGPASPPEHPARRTCGPEALYRKARRRDSHPTWRRSTNRPRWEYGRSFVSLDRCGTHLELVDCGRKATDGRPCGKLAALADSCSEPAVIGPLSQPRIVGTRANALSVILSMSNGPSILVLQNCWANCTASAGDGPLDRVLALTQPAKSLLSTAYATTGSRQSTCKNVEG